MTKFLNISVDNTLGGNSPSDVAVSSQKAVKEYVDAHSGGGGSTAVDNLSITRNSSLQIQTVGVIDSNNTANAVKIWTGTRARYNAIATKNPNTLYNITDDTDVSLTILEALYPVGSVYITTANTCPLSALISGSTWELVSSGRVLQGADSNHVAGTTIEAGLPNITGSFGATRAVGYDTETGAFSQKGSLVSSCSGSGTYGKHFEFNASRSNPIYGKSTTVQPPAFVVNIFERTA